MNDEAEKNFNPDEMNRDEGHMPKEGTPRWVWLAVIVLAGVSILGLGVGWNATTHARNAEKALVFQNKAFEQNVNTLSQRLAQASHCQPLVGQDELLGRPTREDTLAAHEHAPSLTQTP